MTGFLQRIVRDVVSIAATFVLMAAPIAAIIYFSEPASPQPSFMTGWQQVKRDEPVKVIKESFATEPILAMIKKLGE
ncbi:MAG: hypothetical protein E6X17_18250 [Sporomusaceae bacterium]|nr:hypothetical protein [Sporomusaceae bacterium]